MIQLWTDMSKATQLESGGAPGQVQGVPKTPDSRPSKAIQGAWVTTGKMSLEICTNLSGALESCGCSFVWLIALLQVPIGCCEVITSTSTGWWNPQIREMQSRDEISFGFAKGQWQRSGLLAGVIIWVTEHFSTSPGAEYSPGEIPSLSLEGV